ncbi:MAG: energy transducer TonB [Betaproteobacteria bacterium]
MRVQLKTVEPLLAIAAAEPQASLPANVAVADPPPYETPELLAPFPSDLTPRSADPAPGVDPALPVPAPIAISEFNEDEYLPASHLSVRPRAVERISVPYPPDVDRTGVSSAKLTLFIDEEGTVVKLKVDDSDLPPQFQETANHAFARARFNPGRIDDRAVKSRMRIEVMFDSGPAGAPKP